MKYIKKIIQSVLFFFNYIHKIALSVGLKICWLYPLQKECPDYDIKLSDGEAPVMSLSITFTPWFTLTQSGSTCLGPIYGWAVRDVVANMVDCDIVVSKFELQLFLLSLLVQLSLGKVQWPILLQGWLWH